MDKKSLNEFVENATPRILKKYTRVVHDMLSEAQLSDLEAYFKVRVSFDEREVEEQNLREMREKKVKLMKAKAKTPMPEPETQVDEEEEEVPNNLFNEILTQEDLDRMEKDGK